MGRSVSPSGETVRANDIDFDVLRALGDDELKELGLSLGDRKRLLRAIADLPESVWALATAEERAPMQPQPAATDEATSYPNGLKPDAKARSQF